MQTNIKIFGAIILAVATFSTKAMATEVQTASYSSWLATVSGAASEWDFNIPGNTYDTASGYNLSVGSFGPINITGPDGGGYILTKDPGYGASNNIALEGASDGIGSMIFTTPSAGLTAFALGVGMLGNAAPVTMTLSDGESFTLNPAVNGNIFVGFSSATPITSFVLSTTAGSQVALTDFLAALSNEPGNAPSAPAAEVATAVMIGSGLLLFGARRKVFSNLSKPRLKNRAMRIAVSPGSARNT
jgi:hypothetical protein